MRPNEDSIATQPVQETTVMEPASEEDRSTRNEDIRTFQDNNIVDTEEYANDATTYDKFEQELNGIPEAMKVETEANGMDIFVDYIVFDDQRVVKNPNGDYNRGLLELRRGGTITFNFADCQTDCDQPKAIKSVYLIDGDIDDNMILEGNIDDKLKATFEPSEANSFRYTVPNGVTGPNTFNKLVIETQQSDDSSAYYIQKGVEVS